MAMSKAGHSTAGTEPREVSLEIVLLAFRLEAKRVVKAWGGPIDGHDEDDLVQYLIERVLGPEKPVLGRYEPNKGRPVGYMRTYARRRLLDFVRRSLRRQELDAVASVVPSAEATPAEWFSYLETSDRLVRYLRTECSDSDFEIFRALFVEGLSNQEVSRRREVEPKVIATRKHALLKKIRGFLRDGRDDDDGE